MGNRAKIKGPEKKAYVDLQFMNWLAQFCAMVMPRKLRLIAGRGSAKTTEIQVERLIEMVYDMPGAPVAWVADTFANLTANVLPMVFESLERKGFRDGVHYVVEKQPPTFTEKECADLPKWLKPYFWKPYNKIISYKRTIVFFTGLNITFGSLDRPASLAGRSYVHVFGDEVKYFAEAKIGNLLKARRGYRLQFGHSPFYLGETFTTDMPNTGNTGEYDWIFKGAEEMDPETLLLVWKTAAIANDAVQEYIAAKEKFYHTQSDDDRQEYLNKHKTANRWMERWYNLRHHEKAQSMFLIVSSYVNVDILSPQWFADALASQLSDVNAAILSMPPRIEKGQQFYPNLGERHFYTDGNLAAVEDTLGFHDAEDCRLLRHLNPNRAIDMSMDFGNMLSMLIAQDDGRVLRVLKEFHSLPPEWVRELADKFLHFFAPHKHKVVKFYYDRSGNNYKGSNQSMAVQIKEAIERNATGSPTGWRVQLMSLGQANIPMSDEYIFMQELMTGHNPRLPELQIDAIHCRNLKASLELAKTIVDSKGRIGKDKSAEKSSDHKRLVTSTNFSDAFKYMMMRKEWIAIVKRNLGRGLPGGTAGDVSVR